MVTHAKFGGNQEIMGHLKGIAKGGNLLSYYY